MSKRINEKSRALIVFALVVNLYILRMSTLYMIYLFVPLFVVFFIYSLYKYMKFPVKIHTAFILQFTFFYLICLAFIVGLILTKHWNIFLIKESLNIGILLCFIFMFYLHIKTLDDFEIFIGDFSRQFLVLESLIALFGIIKYGLLLSAIKLPVLYFGDIYPWGSSIISDYNFFSLASLLSLCIIIYFSSQKLSFRSLFILHLLFVLHLLNVFFAGSRRGIIVLSLMFLTLVVLRIIFLIKLRTKWKLLSQNITYFLLYFIILGFAVYGFMFSPSGKLREVIKNIASFNETSYKKEITKITFRYSTIFIPREDIKDVYIRIWKKYDLKNNRSWISGDLKNKKDTLRFMEKNFIKVFSEGKSLNMIDFEKTIYGSRTERWRFAINIFKAGLEDR